MAVGYPGAQIDMVAEGQCTKKVAEGQGFRRGLDGHSVKEMWAPSTTVVDGNLNSEKHCFNGARTFEMENQHQMKNDWLEVTT